MLSETRGMMVSDTFESAVLFELRLLREASARIEQQLAAGGGSPSHLPDEGASPSGAGAVVGAKSNASLLGCASTAGALPPIVVAARSAASITSVGGMESNGTRPQRRRSLRQQVIDTSSRSEGFASRITEMTCSASEASQSLAPQSRGRFVAWSLPLGWPTVVKMRTEMHDEEALSPSATVVRRFANNMNMKSMAEVPVENSRTAANSRTTARRSKSRYAINPNSRFHMAYSLSSLVILFFDLTVLPFVLAWEVEFTGALYVSAWMTPVFWTFDIWINFVTAIYKDGDVVTDLLEIARAYGKSWFVPDALVVLCDWVSLILGELLDSADTSRSLKMLRFCKMGRLLRIVGVMRMLRVVRILEEFAALYLTEGYRLMFRMFSLTVSILWTAHLLACFWYAVGRVAPTDTGMRWTTASPVRGADGFVDFHDSPVMYQYMIAFHWASGQIALGSIDIMPTNSIERVVFVLTMMIGFLFGSTLVSMLSAAMMDYQMMQKDITLKLRLLRQYLRQNEVPALVSVLVQKQVEQRLQERERLAENDVCALGLLSVALRAQLRFEIQRPHITRHPLFRLWTGMDERLMHRTCMKAVGFLSLRPRDDLFAPGVLASSAYALVSGQLSYVQCPDSSPVINETVSTVDPGHWVCEVALWVEWTHVGKAESLAECQLLVIDAAALSESLNQDFIVKGITVEYCRQYHKRVKAACPPHAPWPTDLEVPFTDYCDLVVSMAKQVQVAIGREAVSQMSAQRYGRATEQLKAEVDASKSIVVVTGAGSIIRVVSLVVLRAVQPDGRIFMQVGKWDNSEVKSALQLPGAKQEAEELVSETLERMFSTKLTLLQDKLEFLGTARENEEKESKEFGVQTRYLRAICSARLLPDAKLDAPVCEAKDWESFDNMDEVVTHRATAVGSSLRQVLRILQGSDVFAVPTGKQTGNLYAWLPPERLSTLSTTNGEKILRSWLSGLFLPTFSNSDDADAFSDSSEFDSERHLHVIL